MSIRQRLYPAPGQVAGLESLAHYRRFVRNLAVGYGRNWHGHRAGYLVPASGKNPEHVKCRGVVMDVVTDRPAGPSMFTDPAGFLTHEATYLRVTFTRSQAANRAGLSALFTELRAWARTDPDHGWINDGARVVGVGALDTVADGLTNWWAGRARRPVFHRRDDRAGSFYVRDVRVRRLNKHWGLVTIPIVGRVRFRITRPWSQITAATSAHVRLRNGHWHIAFTTPPPAKKTAGTGRTVGIDLGVTNTLATSDGAFLHMPSLTSGEQARYLSLQRRLARQTRTAKRDGRRLAECRNRARTLDALAVLRRRLNNRRTNFIEQTTTALAATYDLVGVETLTITGMTRRPAPKPDPGTPGVWLPNNAAAKAALNRLILASRWGEFNDRLRHKTDAVVAVRAQYSSQECRQCGHIEAGNRESQADFTCRNCGHTAHADINAAHVICARAVAASTGTHLPATRGPSGDRSHQTSAQGGVSRDNPTGRYGAA